MISAPISREKMEFDVVIVGAGPAGLSAAIRLAQLNQKLSNPISICMLEKGAYVGAHLLAGAVLEPSALDELIPDWKQQQAPITTLVQQDTFWWLSATKAWSLPHLPAMSNSGNYVISLGKLCEWLAQYAQTLGVNIFPGFAASNLLLDQGKIIGVQTKDMGLNADGSASPRFQAGIELYAKQTLLAEGCRGSLSEQVIELYQLRQQCNPQSYAVGVKELWEIEPQQHQAGKIIHSIGWPLDSHTYGGGFIYHLTDHKIAVGLVVGLDYQNPSLDPFAELQRFKLHPYIKPLLQGGRCLEYGARALNEGGWQAVPKLTFPGGMLIGCSAGFVNVAKIKGIHNAIRSGMIAAEVIAQRDFSMLNEINEFADYDALVRQSPIMQELHQVRNIRPAFHYSLWAGLAYAALDQYVLRGKAPWTLSYRGDYRALKPMQEVKKINYPKPDGKISFDKLTQLALSGTHHQEHQPCHLILKNPRAAIDINYAKYGSPEQYYCPAGVYEIIQQNQQPQLQINYSNCLHCKSCDIKDPTQNIVWTTPEGGDGPKYSEM